MYGIFQIFKTENDVGENEQESVIHISFCIRTRGHEMKLVGKSSKASNMSLRINT